MKQRLFHGHGDLRSTATTDAISLVLAIAQCFFENAVEHKIVGRDEKGRQRGRAVTLA